MSDILHKVKRLSDAALDLYNKAIGGEVLIRKDDLLDIVNDWRRLDSAYRLERLQSIHLEIENESLRKDAERLDWVLNNCDLGGPPYLDSREEIDKEMAA